MAFDKARKGLADLIGSLQKSVPYAAKHQQNVKVNIENTPVERPNYIAMPKINTEKMDFKANDFNGLFGPLKQARQNPDSFLPTGGWDGASFGEKFAAMSAQAIGTADKVLPKMFNQASRDMGEKAGIIATSVPRLAGVITDSMGLPENTQGKEINDKIARKVALSVEEFTASLVGQPIQRTEEEQKNFTFSDKIVAGISQGIGMAGAVVGITNKVQAVSSLTGLRGFASKYPALLKVLTASEMGAANVLYGQADISQMTEYEGKLKRIGKDFVIGSIFGSLGNIKKLVVAMPAAGALTTTAAYLEGARGEDLAVAAIVGMAMEGTFRAGSVRNPEGVVRKMAAEKMREYGADVTGQSRPEDIKAAYDGLLTKNRTAKDQEVLKRAYEMLTNTKTEVTTPTEKRVGVLSEAVAKISEMVKGKRDGNKYTGDVAAARQIAKIKTEDVATPSDLYARIVDGVKLSPEMQKQVKEYLDAEKVNEMIATGKEDLSVDAFDSVRIKNDRLKIDEAMEPLLFQMETAQAGERIAIPSDAPGVNYEFAASSSTFPKWVPEGLRTRKLFDKVQEMLINGEIPTREGKAKELYDTVIKKVEDQTGLKVNDVKTAEYIFNKLEEVKGFQSDVTEIKQMVLDRLEQDSFNDFVKSPDFQRAMADPELAGMIKDIRDLNKHIDNTLKELTYAEGRTNKNDGAKSEKENVGSKNSEQKSNAEDAKGQQEEAPGYRDTTGSEAQSEKRIPLTTHKEIAKAFEELAADPNSRDVRDESRRLFDDVTEALSRGEIQPESVFRILESDKRLSTEQFARMFHDQVSTAGKELNVLSQLAKRMKASMKTEIEAKLVKAKEAGDKHLIERYEAELKSLERVPDAPDTPWLKIREGFKRVDNIRRGLMVTQVSTTVRNIISQSARTGTMIIDDIQVAMLEAATGHRTTRDAFRRVALDGMAIMKQFTKKGRTELSDYLKTDPLFEEKLLSFTKGEQGATEKVIDKLNTLNRIQETFFRRIVADARISLALERNGITDGNLSKLGPKQLDKIVEEAMEVTFMKTPKAGSFGNAIMNMYQQMPFLSLINAFPRFWMNGLKFLWDYNPTGYSRFFLKANRQAFAKGDYEAYRSIARATTGTAFLAGAFAIRESDSAGDKWYELKVAGKTIDMRPFAPFSTYLFLADNIRAGMGRKVNLNAMDYVQGFLSINRLAGSGLALVDLLRANDLNSFTKIISTVVGAYASSFTVPLKMVKDLIAGFDSEEAYVRYQKIHPLWGPTANNIPYLDQVLPKYPNITAEGYLKNEHPWAKHLTGMNIMEKTWLASEIDRLAIDYQSIYPSTGEKKLDVYVMEEMGSILGATTKALQNEETYITGSDYHKKERILDLLSAARAAGKARAYNKHKDEFIEFERENATKKQEEIRQ
jgi:hypothetical protein